MTEIIKASLIVAVLIGAAIATLRARTLLRSALWLAGVSVTTATLLAFFSARQVAVIELSVGAGLVTILFIFAIGVAGDERVERAAIIPWALAGVLVLGVMTALILLGRSPLWSRPLPALSGQATVYEQVRSLDLIVQVVLIFAGVLGLTGILAEAKAPLDHPMADEIAALREQELHSMERASQKPLEESSPFISGPITPDGSPADAPRSG